MATPHLTAVPSPVRATGALAGARRAQPGWSATPLGDRLRILRRFRQLMAEDPTALAASVRLPQRRDHAETLVTEVLPLLDACRFLERSAGKVLAPRRPGRRGRPLWLAGCELEVRREPRGVVLIVAPANYPLLLPGVQALQALAAGNAVLVKPGVGGTAAALALAHGLTAAGLPGGLLEVLPESVPEVEAAIDGGVDLVVLTGAADTGRTVLRRLAGHPTPAVMELSGCDAVLVREDADVELTAAALAFALTLNGSFTCIAPRRVLVHRRLAHELEVALVRRLQPSEERRPRPVPRGEGARAAALVREALDAGARLALAAPLAGDVVDPLVLADVPRQAAILRADLAAPVLALVTVDDDDDAVAVAAACPYRLGAAVFGTDPRSAGALAGRVAAGVVTVNDLVVPTADPRLPFAGRGASGFGVTRGAEGLLEMTVPKAIATRRGRVRPHLEPAHADDRALFDGYIRLAHGSGPSGRLRALLDIVSLAARRRPTPKETS